MGSLLMGSTQPLSCTDPVGLTWTHVARWIPIVWSAFAPSRVDVATYGSHDLNRAVALSSSSPTSRGRSAMAARSSWARSALSPPRPRNGRLQRIKCGSVHRPGSLRFTCSRRAQRPRGGLGHPMLAPVALRAPRLLKPSPFPLSSLSAPWCSRTHSLPS